MQVHWLPSVMLFLGLASAGCALDGSLPKDRCNGDGDCTSNRICVAGVCTAPDADLQFTSTDAACSGPGDGGRPAMSNQDLGGLDDCGTLHCNDGSIVSYCCNLSGTLCLMKHGCHGGQYSCTGYLDGGCGGIKEEVLAHPEWWCI